MSLWGMQSGSYMGTKPGPITVPSNWGVEGPSASPITSTAKTLTVPAGNSGDIRMHIFVAPSGTIEYIKNGGAATTITQDLIVNFANGDTLADKLTGASDLSNIQFYDKDTDVLIGNSALNTT